MSQPGYKSIPQMFKELGEADAGHTGIGYAVTLAEVASQYKRTERFLEVNRPDYEHRIMLDPCTENLLVLRPNAEGKYIADFDGMKRLR